MVQRGRANVRARLARARVGTSLLAQRRRPRSRRRRRGGRRESSKTRRVSVVVLQFYNSTNNYTLRNEGQDKQSPEAQQLALWSTSSYTALPSPAAVCHPTVHSRAAGCVQRWRVTFAV